MPRKLPESLGLVCLSAAAFALAHPNPLFPRGLGALAFFFFLPAAAALRGARPGRAALQGALFALVGYGLMDSWLAAYDPIAPLVVLPLTACYYAGLFAALAVLGRAFPRWIWATWPFAWVGLEFAKTLGFLGYPYGILGYALYEHLPLAQAASAAGVFGLSALALWPQALLAQELAARELAAQDEAGSPGAAGARGPCGTARAAGAARARGALVLGVLALCEAAGLARLALPLKAEGPRIELALVQPDLPSGAEGLAAYRAALDVLIGESRAALASGAELVAWPETAFVPSIDYHLRYRPDRGLYDLVRECRDFIAGSGADFLVGNDHGARGPGGAGDRVDYNAALAFPKGGGGPEVYAKSRLVPFAEWFPFEGALPRLHAFFERKAGGFWEPGPGPASLPLAGTRVAAPICFEDCFGEGVRAMAGDGVGLVLALVNDEWSRSEAAERQHLACSVFRAIETGKPVARAANSGLTALVDGRGRILDELPPFERGALRAAVDCAPGARTAYLAVGDLFARACLGLALGALAAAAIELAGRRKRRP